MCGVVSRWDWECHHEQLMYQVRIQEIVGFGTIESTKIDRIEQELLIERYLVCLNGREL